MLGFFRFEEVSWMCANPRKTQPGQIPPSLRADGTSRTSGQDGWPSSQNFLGLFSSPIATLDQVLEYLQCSRDKNGKLSWQDGEWGILAPVTGLGKLAHLLRNHRRKVQLNLVGFETSQC